jgi:hypothetical protein
MGDGNILLGMQETINENEMLREQVARLRARVKELEDAANVRGTHE